MYNFVGCLGVEFVQFQDLLQEPSGDLFYQFSLRELTLSGPYRFKSNRPLAVFSLTVGVNDMTKVTGIWRLRVPRPSGQEMGHISNRHVIPNQVRVVFKGNFHRGYQGSIPSRVIPKTCYILSCGREMRMVAKQRTYRYSQ